MWMKCQAIWVLLYLLYSFCACVDSGVRSGDDVTSLSTSTSRSRRKAPHRCRLSEKDRSTFVEKANNYRRMVQPPASNMHELKWDENLADVAQQWVDRCTYEQENDITQHEPQVFSRTAFVIKGKVLTGAYDDRQRSATQAIDSWFSQRVAYNYSANSCELDAYCGDYTQLVSAEARYFGCAIEDCSAIKNRSAGSARLVACFYDGGDTDIGQKPYLQGPPCSDCRSPNGCDVGLCVSAEPCTLDCSTMPYSRLNRDTCRCQCLFGFERGRCVPSLSRDRRSLSIPEKDISIDYYFNKPEVKSEGWIIKPLKVLQVCAFVLAGMFQRH